MTVSSFDEGNEAMVHLCSLPGNVKGFCVPNGDGYTIVLNDNLSPKALKDAYQHEVQHIKNGDHYKEDYQEYRQK